MLHERLGRDHLYHPTGVEHGEFTLAPRFAKSPRANSPRSPPAPGRRV